MGRTICGSKQSSSPETGPSPASEAATAQPFTVSGMPIPQQSKTRFCAGPLLYGSWTYSHTLPDCQCTNQCHSCHINHPVPSCSLHSPVPCNPFCAYHLVIKPQDSLLTLLPGLPTALELGRQGFSCSGPSWLSQHHFLVSLAPCIQPLLHQGVGDGVVGLQGSWVRQTQVQVPAFLGRDIFSSSS